VIFAFATIQSEALSGAAALVALATGVMGGAARYAAVLHGRSENEVEKATAIGFFVGLGFTVMALVSEYAS
jgi:ribosomal protein S18 acetylase RimI-like enzyme